MCVSLTQGVKPLRRAGVRACVRAFISVNVYENADKDVVNKRSVHPLHPRVPRAAQVQTGPSGAPLAAPPQSTWHWLKRYGCVFPAVWSGVSHCNAVAVGAVS